MQFGKGKIDFVTLVIDTTEIFVHRDVFEHCFAYRVFHIVLVKLRLLYVADVFFVKMIVLIVYDTNLIEIH